jgi:hypothetical protein
VKNDYGTEQEAWDLNGLEDPLKKQGGPVIPPGTGFPFRRLLRLAEQYNYSYTSDHALPMEIKGKMR